ncbi:Exo-endo-phos-2 multi-domain protein [Pyrenophora tritici-repentis]|nr:Exo-endo-phos-2 multi-domain protein [Pyrenophora tritici-repentis]
MANVETPERAPRSAQPPHTRSEEPESPINTDLRGNKRRQRAHTRAEPSIGSTAPTSYNQAVSEAVRQRIQAAQKATNLHHSIITDLATAVDRCLGKYTDPDGARVAKDLQQKVLRAINTSLITPLITPPNSGSDSDTTHRSWADVARTLKNPTPPARGAATTKAATAAPKQLAQTPRRPLNTDNRILIAVGAEARLQRASPFAARMAIVKAIKEITPSDIPTAKHIKTGWAITPRNDKIKALLMGQENRELMIRAVEGESARLPERWVNYAVQGVESSYRTITGESIPTTIDDIVSEALSQTGIEPASCRPSRHGPTEGRTTWIISFTRPVRSFRLFGTGDYAHEIKKNSPAMLHDPGCLGKTTATHQGPHGEQCKDTPKCANCHGPFPATHDKCPAAPTRANGRLIQPTKGELKVIREAGDRASEAMQPARGRQTGSTVETSIEITDGDIANTTEPVGTPTDASKRSRQDVNNLNTATVREPATTLGTRRSKRTAATTQDLNLARMSARSVQPSTADQDPNTSSSEHADTEMSLGSICIQEPFTLTGTRTSTHPGFHMISPVISWNNPTTWGTDRPRVLTYTRKSPNIRATLIHPRISRDVLWIEANGYRILNVYRQPQNDSTFQYLTALTPPRNCLVGGDLNARHELFEPGSTSANRGAEIARWATQNDIPYIGEAGNPTHRAGHVLDVSFSNIPFARTTVREDMYTGSDHFTLVTVLPSRGRAVLEQHHYRVHERNIDRFAGLVQLYTVGVQPISNSAPADVIDASIARITQAIGDAMHAAGTPNREKGHSAPWWTEDCRVAYKRHIQEKSDYGQSPSEATLIRGRAAGNRRIPRSKVQRVAQLLPATPRNVLASPHFSYGSRQDPTQGQGKDIAAQNFTIWWESLGQETITVFSDGSEQQINGTRVVTYGYAIYQGQAAVATGQGSLNALSHVFDAEAIGACRGLKHALQLSLPSQREIVLCIDSTSVIWGIRGAAPASSQWAFLQIHGAMEAYSVKTRWAPGHMKIVGNELADQLADNEAKDPHQPYGMAASPTRSGIRTVGRRLLEHTRDTWWKDKSSRLSAWYTQWQLPYDTRRTPAALWLPRRILAKVLMIRSTHGDFEWYHRKFNHEDTSKCLCGRPKTPEHLVFCKRATTHFKKWPLRPIVPPRTRQEGLAYLAQLIDQPQEFETFVKLTPTSANRGAEIARWATQNDIPYIGEAGNPTHRAGHVLDVSFSNIPFARTTVREDMYTGSDHFTLVTVLPSRGRAVLEQHHYRVHERNIDRFAGLVQLYTVGVQPISNSAPADVIDASIARITQAIGDAMHAAGTPNREKGHSAPWWTEDCRVAYKRHIQEKSDYGQSPSEATLIRGRAAGNRRIPRSKVQRVAQLLPATPRNVLASPHFSDGSRQDPTQGQGKDIAAQNFTIWWESLGQETITVFSDGSEQQINGTRVVTYGYAIYQGQAAVATGQGSLNALSHVFDAEAIGACRGLKHALQLSLPSQREIVLCIDSTAVIWGIRGTAPTSSQWAFLQIHGAMEAYNVKTRWAPGHMKIVGNELADQLADNEAKDPHQPYGMAASPTRSGIRTVGRRLLEHTRDTWWKDKSSRLSAWYTQWQLPYDTRRTPAALWLPRRILAKVLMIRSTHGDFEWYHRKFNHEDTSKCLCGRPKTPEHLVFCKRATTHFKKWPLRPIVPPRTRQEGLAYLAQLIDQPQEFETFVKVTNSFYNE